MITLTILAFLFVVGVIVVILVIAAEGLVVFPLLDLAVAVAIVVAIVRVLSPKKR